MTEEEVVVKMPQMHPRSRQPPKCLAIFPATSPVILQVWRLLPHLVLRRALPQAHLPPQLQQLDQVPPQAIPQATLQVRLPARIRVHCQVHLLVRLPAPHLVKARVIILVQPPVHDRALPQAPHLVSLRVSLRVILRALNQARHPARLQAPLQVRSQLLHLPEKGSVPLASRRV
jgi:hypothetical protein